MKRNLIIFAASIITFSLVFSGCSNSVQTVNNSVKIDETPKYQTPKRVEPPKPRAKGSLYANRGGSLFSDRKELQIGDIVFVKIQENTTASTSSTILQEQLNNERTANAANITANENTPGLLTSIIDGINGLLGIGIGTGNSTSIFEAESESSLKDAFNNNMAAVIAQAFQNGNYFIQGEKQIAIKGQKVTVVVSGVINPSDLDKTSTIASDRIANLKTMVYRTGSEADLEEKPWGTKIIDSITPF